MRMFIRVELTNGAHQEHYELLHTHMGTRGFLKTLTGIGSGNKLATVTLPTGTSTGQSVMSPVALAQQLQASIEATVWSSAAVLALRTGEDWGIAGADLL